MTPLEKKLWEVNVAVLTLTRGGECRSYPAQFFVSGTKEDLGFLLEQTFGLKYLETGLTGSEDCLLSVREASHDQVVTMLGEGGL
jgi:hypothetical protein